MKIFICLLILLGPNLKNTFAQVGQIAPDFKVTDTHGQQHHLYDYLEKGKTVVLDFFFTTCTPCQYYTPQVNLAYKKYGCNKKDVVFISIDHNDTNAEVLAYDATYKIEYPSISGLEGGGNAVVNAYNIIGFPTFYVIDSSKKIVMEIDPPTLQVFDFRFNQLGLTPKDCEVSQLSSYEMNYNQQIKNNLITDNTLTLVCNEPIYTEQSLLLYEYSGQQALHEINIPAYNKLYEVKLPGLPPGYYFGLLRNKRNEGIISVSFIKL
ncbi:MAG: TlpA family protein disulfide reductase [Saprospiraceae bacterium]|nr:TlpA family protein disulfide reductase [Saprospiraceae bacterium]